MTTYYANIAAITTVERLIQEASQLTRWADYQSEEGNSFVENLDPPAFSTSSVSASAPLPQYIPPTYLERTFTAPTLSSLEVGLTAPRPIAFSYTIPDSALFGTYDLTSADSIPVFTWANPPAPATIAAGALAAAPTVSPPTAIQLPDVTGLASVDPSNAPLWDASVEFDTSGVPGAKPTLDHLTAPTVTVPLLPAVPEWDRPESVVLSAIDLPTLTPLVIPDVSNVAIPSLVLPELQSRLDFTESEFDDSLAQELMAEVRTVLGGRLAIPSHIWTRIWERVAADVNRQYLARKREAQRAHAKLGWSMPGGVMLEALQVAATEINAEISAKANEIAIKQAEMQQADYWQAMQHGTALTTLLSQIHNARQERLLKAALAALEANVTAYNAVVTAYNAEVQAVSADIETKKLQLQAELTKVEVYKTEMEGAKLGVEVDKAKVEMYTAQWTAVKTQAEAYESMVRGVQAQVEAQKAGVEAYGQQVQAQATVVQMWATEWEAYAKKLEAEKLKLGKFETEARAFESQVNGYRAWIDGQASRSNIQIEGKKLELQRAQIDATRYQADWQGEQIKMAGYEAYIKGQQLPIEAAKVNADIFQARVQGEVGRSQAWGMQYDAYTKLLQKDAVRAQMQNSYATIYGAVVDREKMFLDWAKHSSELTKSYEMLVQEYNKAVVAEHSAQAQYQAAQLNANAQAFGVGAEIYKADVQGATATAQLGSDIYRASIEIAKANADVSIEAAKVTTAQWQIASQLTQAQMQASAAVYSQLGAAAFAATNASVGSSYSDSNSESVSTSYNWSGQLTGES